MKVLKFGGSSLGTAARIRRVAKIISDASQADRLAVVLSAMKGVTDSLISCAKSAASGDPGYTKELEAIDRRHRKTAEELLGKAGRGETGDGLGFLFKELEELKDVLHGVELIRECSPLSLDLIMSFGERIICRLFARFLESLGIPAEMVDARQIIVTNSNHGCAVVSPVTYTKIRERLSGARKTPIVTGFIASSEKGATTTLGRNGSDYTASLIGAGLSAEAIEIWTDVDGVLSADPSSVKNAFVIPELSYQEAMELSYFGAEVIHPYTMIPAVENGIPIRIKNTFHPGSPGTLISAAASPKGTPITGIASIEHVALVNVEGGGMIGIPGFAARIFGALARHSISIIMISQASSEHSICLVFQEDLVDKVRETLRGELETELRTKRIQEFEIMGRLVIVAVIGENMRGTPGISGRLFSALGKEGINVLAIAQGSSERNISLVISAADKGKALRSIHRAFLESEEGV